MCVMKKSPTEYGNTKYCTLRVVNDKIVNCSRYLQCLYSCIARSFITMNELQND